MTPDTISARIKHARGVAGLSPQEMREKLRNLGRKYSQGGWHRVENTEPTNPNLQLIKAISRSQVGPDHEAALRRMVHKKQRVRMSHILSTGIGGDGLARQIAQEYHHTRLRLEL